MNGIINWVKANRVKAALIAASSILLPWCEIEIAGSRAINGQIAPYPLAQRQALELAISNQVDQLDVEHRLVAKLTAISGSKEGVNKLIPLVANAHKQFCDLGQNGLAQAIGLNVMNAKVDARTDLDELTRKFLKTALAVALTAPCSATEAEAPAPTSTVQAETPVQAETLAPVKPEPVESAEPLPDLPGFMRNVQVTRIEPRTVTVIDPPSNVRSTPMSKSDDGIELNNVVAVHGAKTQLRITASADLPKGTWFYVPSDRGWIHSSQVR